MALAGLAALTSLGALLFLAWSLRDIRVLGDMKTGIIIGGTLEMIALGWMNIGAAVAPDAALASIISTILV
ncbi:hypothetical protein E2K66_24325, partial [Escherichia coli]